MTGFVPGDCLSCVDALNETYQELFGTTHRFTDANWSVVFSDRSVLRSASLNHEYADRMKQAVHKLQGQLFGGERVACFVSDDGLEDVKPAVFGKQHISQILANNGNIKPQFVGPSVTFFVRPKGYERSDYIGGLAKNEDVAAEKSSGGRPNTGRDAALIYWGMFPDGHDGKGSSWKSALRDVNRQLERRGLKTVAMTAFKVNVNELRPRQ